MYAQANIYFDTFDVKIVQADITESMFDGWRVEQVWLSFINVTYYIFPHVLVVISIVLYAVR